MEPSDVEQSGGQLRSISRGFPELAMNFLEACWGWFESLCLKADVQSPEEEVGEGQKEADNYLSHADHNPIWGSADSAREYYGSPSTFQAILYVAVAPSIVHAQSPNIQKRSRPDTGPYNWWNHGS